MNKQTVQDIDIKNKRVLMRVDYNVPLDENLAITDDARIVKSLDTVKYILSQNASLVLMSHLGRPKGPEAKLSLKPAAERLSKLIGKKVELAPDSIGAEVEAKVKALKSGEVLMLENLRFHAEEEKNDPAFAKKLAAYGDVYVNDAFGTAHRAHASTEGVTKHLPAVAGFLLAKEVEYFDKIITNPERPFVTILGGAKVSDKIKLISNLLNKADTLLVGGAMAYTFYKVQGIGIGNSKFDPAGLDAAKNALAQSKAKNVPMVLPVDRVIAQKMEKGAETKVTSSDIPDGWSGFDVGPESCKKFKEVLSKAKTILWNGPLGLFEIQPFDKGTREIAEYIATLKATTIIGGGDTAAAVVKFGLEDKMSHVSTGGGASLEYLEGTVLPGIAALRDKQSAVSHQPSAK
jgi:phosphoglycerate kinase